MAYKGELLLLLRIAEVQGNNKIVILCLLLMGVTVLASRQSVTVVESVEQSNIISYSSGMKMDNVSYHLAARQSVTVVESVGQSSIINYSSGTKMDNVSYHLLSDQDWTTSLDTYVATTSFEIDTPIDAQIDSSIFLKPDDSTINKESDLNPTEQSTFQSSPSLVSKVSKWPDFSTNGTKRNEPSKDIQLSVTSSYEDDYISSKISAQETVQISQYSAQMLNSISAGTEEQFSAQMLNTISADTEEQFSASLSNVPDLRSSLAPSFTIASYLQTIESNLVQNVVNVTTYPSPDYSKSRLGALATFNTAALETMTIIRSTPSSGHNSPFPHPQSTIDQHIIITPTKSFSSQLEYISSSQSTIDDILNSTVCCPPKESQSTSDDEKEWAIPVTVCLAALLLLTWIIVFIVCRRSRSESVDSQNRREHGQYNTAHRQTEDQQQHSESPTPFSKSTSSSRQGKQPDQKDIEQNELRFHKNFHHKEADVYLRNYHNNHRVASNTREIDVMELEDISRIATQNEDYHKREYHQHQHHHEFRIENEAINYDNYSFASSSPEIHNGHLTVHSPPWPEYRVSESKDGLSFSDDYNSHLQLRLSLSGNHTNTNVSNEIMVSPGNRYYIQATKRSDSEFSSNHNDTKGDKEMELKQFKSQVPDTDNIHDDYDDEDGWYEDDGKITHDEIDDGENAIMNKRDNDSIDIEYLATQESKNNDNIVRAVKTKIVQNRPGISKCVSFDDTQLQRAQDKILIKKTSESATPSFSSEQDNFLNMTYKTMDNLSELENSNGDSRFYIGFYSESVDILGQGKKQHLHHLNQRARNSTAEMHQLNDKIFMKSKSAEKINKNEEDYESQFLKPTDDYIFPIGRKVKVRNMAERQHILINKSGNKHEGEDISFKTLLLRDASGSDRHFQDHTKTDADSSNDTPFLPSSSISDEISEPPTRRVSQPSKLPTIILTNDENEIKEENENTNASSRPARVRRIARANNPFLIEVQPSTEKVRRSSAPSMARSSHYEKGTINNDRIIRSSSGDHLCLNPHNGQYDRHNLYTTRSWSSEFFNLINNKQSGNNIDDKFVKKMIDDRYDALFSNKYPHPMSTNRSDNRTFKQDTSSRIFQLMSNPSHSFLPPAEELPSEQGCLNDNKDYEKRARNLPETKLGQPTRSFDNSEQDRNILRDHAILQKITKSELSEEDDVSLSNSNDVTLEFSDNIQSNISSLSGSKNPRPSLTYGKDGMDSDSEIEQPDSRKNLQKNIDSKDESKLHRFKGHERYGNDLNNKKGVLSKMEWESFDDDFEKDHLSNNVSFSETLTTSERDKDISNTLDVILERPSFDDAMKDIPILKNESSTDVKQIDVFSLPIKSVNVETRDKYLSDNQSDTFSESTFPLELQETTSVSSSETVLPDVLPCLNEETFDDNFDINVNNKIEMEQAGNEEESNKTSSNQKQGQKAQFILNRKMLTRNKTVPTEKAQGRGGKKILKTERIKRSPPPLLLNYKQNYNVTDDAKKVVRREDEDNSIPVLNTNLNNAKPTPLSSSSPEPPPRKSRQKKTRSHSLAEPVEIKGRVKRAMTLETDKLAPYFKFINDWSKLFGGNESRFVSSANNTLLQHTIAEDTTNINTSISEPEKELYFGSSSSPVNVARNLTDREKGKQLLFNEDNDDSEQATSV